MTTVSTLESLPVKKKRKTIKGKNCRKRQQLKNQLKQFVKVTILRSREKINRNQETIGAIKDLNIVNTCRVTPSLYSSTSRYGGRNENFSHDTIDWYRQRLGVNEYLEVRRTKNIANPLGLPDGQVGVFAKQDIRPKTWLCQYVGILKGKI